jgi:hypothetical protein
MQLHELLPQCKYTDRIWRSSWLRGQFVIVGKDNTQELCRFVDTNGMFRIAPLGLTPDNIMAQDWEKVSQTGL